MPVKLRYFLSGECSSFSPALTSNPTTAPTISKTAPSDTRSRANIGRKNATSMAVAASGNAQCAARAKYFGAKYIDKTLPNAGIMIANPSPASLVAVCSFRSGISAVKQPQKIPTVIIAAIGARLIASARECFNYLPITTTTAARFGRTLAGAIRSAQRREARGTDGRAQSAFIASKSAL